MLLRLQKLTSFIILACASGRALPQQLELRHTASRFDNFLDARRPRAASLAQIATRQQVQRRSAEGKESESKATDEQGPLAASFFGSFAEGESRYSVDADESARLPEAWELKPDEPDAGGVEPAKFYHESKSLANKAALQTHYPSLQSGIASRNADLQPWRMTDGGKWVTDYTKTSDGENKIKAQSSEWFEASIKHYDGYGRARPSEAKFLSDGTWLERAVNTTLTCREAGCEAASILQVFDPSIEQASGCKLSLYLHPTDFDDQYSGERLTYIKVNGVTVNTDCFPMMNGCAGIAQRPMFPCLSDLPLDSLIDKMGKLTIQSQISDVVDECPYEGNLLSGVPMVTCMVKHKVAPPATMEHANARVVPEPARPVIPQVPEVEPEARYVFLSAPLRCPERGCTATAQLWLNHSKFQYSQCLLSIKLNQTDFDGDSTYPEELEFIKVDNTSFLETNLHPLRNPCKAEWEGKPLSLSEIEHVALSNRDVTDLAADGVLNVAAKISDHVDECASEGYLLQGYVAVNCTVDSNASHPPVTVTKV